MSGSIFHSNNKIDRSCLTSSNIVAKYCCIYLLENFQYLILLDLLYSLSVFILLFRNVPELYI